MGNPIVAALGHGGVNNYAHFYRLLLEYLLRHPRTCCSGSQADSGRESLTLADVPSGEALRRHAEIVVQLARSMETIADVRPVTLSS